MGVFFPLCLSYKVLEPHGNMFEVKKNLDKGTLNYKASGYSNRFRVLPGKVHLAG